MNSFNIPKKLLRVEDLTFILPDDFDGNIQSALRLLAAYLDIEFLNGRFNPKNKRDSDQTNLEELFGNNEKRVSMNYGIFEMDEKDGKYYLKGTK